MIQGTVILQARMGSTRLPGKVLKEILGQPLLWYAIQTLRQSPVVDRIVLATTEKQEDDALVHWADREKIDCFRGSEEDVLDRYYRSACRFNAPYYFRATGDNPILDVGNLQRTLSALLRTDSDYACEEGMPIGSVVECFTHQALTRCQREAKSAASREHVTLFMRESGLFQTVLPACPGEYRCEELRLTVDHPEDFQRTQWIIENLYRQGIPPFSAILNFCNAHPFQSFPSS